MPQKGRLSKSPLKGSKLATKFFTAHSPTVSCFLSLHIEEVSGIFLVALTQVTKAKKNPECGRNKKQRSPARIVSGAGNLKSPGSLKSRIGDGWGMFFSKAASKGLPRPFNEAGWRCSKGRCSRLKSSMPFKRDLALQNIPLQNNPSKRNPNLKLKASVEVLNIIYLSQEPTSVGHCDYEKWG